MVFIRRGLRTQEYYRKLEIRTQREGDGGGSERHSVGAVRHYESCVALVSVVINESGESNPVIGMYIDAVMNEWLKIIDVRQFLQVRMVGEELIRRLAPPTLSRRSTMPIVPPVLMM